MVGTSLKDPAAAPAGSAIAGGFVLVPAASLMAAWRACRARPLGMSDFRAWLACREMTARRCQADPDRPSAYTVAELAKLGGVSEKRARASVRRLTAAGLLEWSEFAIAFPGPPSSFEPGLEDTIGGGKGFLAIPRRMLRLLAGGARPALIATVLALLLRCLSRRQGRFDGRGRVKASWIAGVFGIDLRRVKAARLELVNLGWITPEPGGQIGLNRWGRAYRINLSWDRSDDSAGRALPPPPSPVRPAIATPSLINQDPLQEKEKHQKPASGGPSGVEVQGTGEGSQPLPSPNLNDVRPEDLKDTARTLELFGQAVARKLVGSSENGRLLFLAAAEHARAVGTVNPGGLFARLVRRGWWHFATQDDEDVARRRLREHLYGRPSLTGRPPAGASSFAEGEDWEERWDDD